MSVPGALPVASTPLRREKTVATWQAARRAEQALLWDKWVLGSILLERFITRLFSDKWTFQLLPSWTNYLDYPFLVLFAFYVMWRVRDRYRGNHLTHTGFGRWTALLLVCIGVSTLANTGRLHPGAYSLFIIGLLEPLAFMILAYILAPRREVITWLLKLLYLVGWLQIIVVAVIDMPLFLTTRNPDYISGTFGMNAYQMTWYLLTWNVLLLSRRTDPRYRLARTLGIGLLQVLIVIIILLAQFRALLPFALVTWMLTYVMIERRPARGVIIAGASTAIFLGLFLVVATAIPELKWNDIIELGSRSDEVVESGKVQSILNFGRLLYEQPQILLVGTGPGTYASRGFQTFSVAGAKTFASKMYQQLFGGGDYTTDVALEYVLPVLRFTAFGSSTAAVPWFSYLAIPAELGVLGLVAVLSIYGRAVRLTWLLAKGTDELAILARWLCIALVLLLQMAALENWLEASRATVPVWTLMGVVLAHHLNSSLTLGDMTLS